MGPHMKIQSHNNKSFSSQNPCMRLLAFDSRTFYDHHRIGLNIGGLISEKSMMLDH